MRVLPVAIVWLACVGIAVPVAAVAQQTPAMPRQGQTLPSPRAPASPGAATPGGAGQFSTEAEARRHCPTDNVVWANSKSKIYHYAGSRTYGKTKEGAYMCQKESDSTGFRAAKNEKPPAKTP